MKRRLRILMAAFVFLVGLALTDSQANAGYLFTSFDGPNTKGPNGLVGTTTANGINNNGNIVGFSTVNGVNFNFIFNSHTGTFINSNLLPNDAAAMANGINNANTVVGVSGGGHAIELASGATNPTVLANPTTTTTSSMAFGINDKGVIVGQYTDSATGTTPGFILNNNTYTTLNPTDQKTGAPATVTNAQGINNNGVGVGFESATIGPSGVPLQFGFKFNLAGNTSPLPNPSTPLITQDGLALTQFLSVNDNGIAVGYYQTNGGSQHGFLFNLATDTYTFLDDPNAVPGTTGASITQITGINNAGEIEGFYLNADGLMRGFYANPTPEPASLTLFGIGLAGLAGYGWRRRKLAV